MLVDKFDKYPHICLSRRNIFDDKIMRQNWQIYIGQTDRHSSGHGLLQVKVTDGINNKMITPFPTLKSTIHGNSFNIFIVHIFKTIVNLKVCHS